MQINWFTVIAEIVNFLVLVWLLKRFLYKPVLDAIEERERKITAQLQDAEDKKSEAKKGQDEFRKKTDEFENQKKTLMDKAVADSNMEHEKLLGAARNDANALSIKLEIAAKQNQENQDREIEQNTQEQVLAIARKALSEIASVNIEGQSVDVFIMRLKESKDEERKKLIEAFQSNGNTIVVQSAFELPLNQQADLNSTINEILGTKTQMQFKTAKELISGIELTTNGYKLAWSIDEYLKSLEKDISTRIKERSTQSAEKE